MPSPRMWMYKWNNKGRFHEGKGRDWNAVFDEGGEFTGFGFDNPIGRGLIGEVSAGDLVIAYQTDQRAAIGMCEIIRVEQMDGEPRVRFHPRRRFAKPVKLHDLKRKNEKLKKVDALRQGPVQSFYRISPDEAIVVLAACGMTGADIATITGPH